MRDFRDAKTMAHALRDALKSRAVETTHSECLELIARVFGFDNWNILCAKIEAAAPVSAERSASVAARNDRRPTKTLYCSFCGKSQYEVRRLVAGPEVYICDECVALCTDFVDDVDDDKELARLLERDADWSTMSTEDLAHYVERGRKGVERNRLTLRAIEQKLGEQKLGQQKLEMRDQDLTTNDDILALPRFIYLRNKTREELLTLHQIARHQLSRYEEALQLATTALGARRQ
jgi:hypothetical protein